MGVLTLKRSEKMKTLGIHSKFFRFSARERAIEGAEIFPAGDVETNIDRECLVIFISVEKVDATAPGSVAAQLTEDTLKRAEQLHVKTAVIYPYVHLTDNPSSQRIALKVLGEIESSLSDSLEVVRAPFGWYISFEIACMCHPLSEWSGRYYPGKDYKASSEKIEKRGATNFTHFKIVDLDGNIFDITQANFKGCPIFSKGQPVYDLLKQFVSNELGHGVVTEGPPKHIQYMRNHELLDYCEVSEKGHFKWYPQGLLIQRLLLDYASHMAYDWGAIEMKNPIVIRGDHNVVGELMGEFHERDYQVDGGRGICYLRYASDPLAFPFMQNVRFSHKQSPLKVYEETSCFRNEQQGEVSGLKRVRNFTMTDMHAACCSGDQAWKEFELLCFKFANLMNDIIARGRWVLGWEGTISFFNANRDRLISIGKTMGVPAFFKLMPEMSHYYAIKNEYQFITEDRSNIQVSTVQWDVKDGKRFDIGFIDEHGQKKPCPVIIHASSFGSIERAMCALLEKIAIDARSGAVPMFPLWLAPTQVRIIPVSDGHLSTALKLSDKISSANIRVDVDDRDGTVGKKIRDGEMEWIPYLTVIGERERRSRRLTIRSREDGCQMEMPIDQFIQIVLSRTDGMPKRPLPLPKLVSQRPIFSR
jgi:threonyl-tRNA synthetase